MSIVLASGSRIRRQLLENAGIDVLVKPPGLDEKRLRDESKVRHPEGLAEMLARAKAESVADECRDDWIIGADQVLVCEGRIYSKPEAIEEAREHLRELRGRTHELVTSVAVARHGRATWHAGDKAVLTMRRFSDAFLSNYLASVADDVCQSVGAYKLEGRGTQLFERIEGSYFTILGLPLLPLLQQLRNLGCLPA